MGVLACPNLSHITQGIEVTWGFGASGRVRATSMLRHASAARRPSCDESHIKMCVLNSLVRAPIGPEAGNPLSRSNLNLLRNESPAGCFRQVPLWEKAQPGKCAELDSDPKHPTAIRKSMKNIYLTNVRRIASSPARAAR